MVEESDHGSAPALISGIEGERLKQVFSNLPAAVVVLQGPDHVFQFANEQYRRLIGSRRELLGLPLRLALPELAEQGYVKLLDDVYRTGEPFYGWEMPSLLDRLGDGRLDETYFNFVYVPIRNAEGEIDGILTHGTEVTESVRSRQRVEQLVQDLERQRATLETVIEEMPAGVVFADASGKITDANSVWRAFFQVPLEDLDDVNSWKVFEGYRPNGSRYEVDEYPLARTIRTGETVIGEHLEFRRDEGVRTIEVSSAPVRDQAGTFVSSVAVFFDVTERLALERELAANRATEQAQMRLDHVLDAAGDGIWVLDNEGRTSLVNPAAQRMTGYTSAEAVGRIAHELIHHSRPDGTPYPLEQCPIHGSVRRGEQSQADDEMFWRKDGTSFPVSYRATPIYSGGEHVGTVQVFRDLTEERRMEAVRQRAREAEASQQQALQLNDDILQGLVVAQLSLEFGQADTATETLRGTIAAMKGIINNLLSVGQDGDVATAMSLVRDAASGEIERPESGGRDA